MLVAGLVDFTNLCVTRDGAQAPCIPAKNNAQEAGQSATP